MSSISSLPVELRELIVSSIPMGKVVQLKNRQLWINCCNNRYREFKTMPLGSIFRTAIDRIDAGHPNWGKGKKVAHCIKSVNSILQEAFYFLSGEQLQSFGIKRQGSMRKLTYVQRMALAEMISEARGDTLIRFFNGLALDVPEMQTFRDEILNRDAAPREQARQIRQWINANRSLLIQGEPIELNEERHIPLMLSGIPAEISTIFERFSKDFKLALIAQVCKNGLREPFERLLHEHSQSIMGRAPLLASLLSASCQFDQFDFIEKCINHPFFSTAIQTPLLPLEVDVEEEEVLPQWEGTQRDWLQVLVQAVAEHRCQSLNIWLSLPEANRLFPPNVFNGCIRSNDAKSLRILNQFDLAKRLAPDWILNKMLDGSPPITAEKLLALMEFSQLRGISADWFEPHIDKWLSEFCLREDHRENHKRTLRTLLDAFPELDTLLLKRIAADPSPPGSAHEEPLAMIRDLVLSHQIASRQERDGESFLMPPPAAQQRRVLHLEEKKK